MEKTVNKNSKDKKIWRLAVVGIVLVALIGGIVILAISDSNAVKPAANVVYDDTFDSLLNVSLMENSVFVEPHQLKIKLGDYTASVGMNLENAGVYSTFNEQDTFLVTYILDNIQYDIIMSNRAHDIGSFTTEDIMNICSDKKSEVMTHKNYDEETRVCKSESLISLYRMAYAYVCKSTVISEELEGFDSESMLTKLDTESYANELKSITLFEKKDTDNIEVAIKGFESIRLNNLSFLSKPGYNYSVTDGILSIVDCDDFHTAVFVTGMNNSHLGNINLKMIQHPDYNNVYLDCEYYKSDAFGYRSFSVMTDVGMYYFKIGEYEDNADAIMTELLEKLGVKPDDEKIELGYDLVLTMEDMIYTDEDYLTEEDITSDTDATVENEDAGKETVPNIKSVPIEQSTEVNTNDGAAISAPTDIAGPSDATNKD